MIIALLNDPTSMRGKTDFLVSENVNLPAYGKGTGFSAYVFSTVCPRGSGNYLQTIIEMLCMGLLIMTFANVVILYPHMAFADEVPQVLVDAAKERTRHSITYDGNYYRIEYPNGDVPADKGVCTDVVIRVYRSMGIDLQKLVHEDMRDHFSSYPKRWGLTAPDPNIDHRRVPNLQTFFERNGKSLPITQEPQDYLPGDIITWILPGSLPHIGIVVDEKSGDGNRYLIVHNIGAGPQMEDVLFRYPVSGHYRYY